VSDDLEEYLGLLLWWCLFCVNVICFNSVFLCVLRLMFIDMFHVLLQLMQRLDQWIYLSIYLFIRVTGLSSNFSSLALMNSILIYIISFILAWKYRSVKGYRGCTLYREYKLLPISCAKIRMRWCRLQRANIETNCFFKIWLLEKMRGKIIGRCSTLEHMDCRAFPP